ncbi:MAG: hypothetical protein ACLPY1_04905 [Terracidiphilus sp.]
MIAGDTLDTRRDESPLGPAGDRIAAIFARLVPLVDPRLKAMRQSGALVAGEVTNPLPNAKAFHYQDDSHAIMIFSGLIDFYECVSRTLFGAMNLDYSGTVTKAALSITDVVANLRVLFEAWTPEGIAQDRIAHISQSPLSPDRAELAALLVKMALSFILSHEFGHVLYYKPPKGPKSIPKLTLKQETESDQAGSRNLLIAAGPEGIAQARMSIAGVMVSLRVLAVLGDLGHTFGESHPPPLDRLNTVVRSIRGACNSEREYWSLSTIAYSFDEQLQVAGAQAVGKTPPRTYDHAISRLVSMLEEIVKGHTPSSDLLPGMRMDFEGLSDEDLGVLAGMAAILFPEAPVSTNDERQDKMWAAMGAFLRNAIQGFPDRARAVFQFAFSPANQKTNQTKG